jgi:hypothetical protein
LKQELHALVPLVVFLRNALQRINFAALVQLARAIFTRSTADVIFLLSRCSKLL